MKKYILVFLITLAISMNTSSENLTKVNSVDAKTINEEFGVCDDVYFAVRDAYFQLTGDLIRSIRSGMAAENICMETEEEIMEDPGQ